MSEDLAWVELLAAARWFHDLYARDCRGCRLCNILGSLEIPDIFTPPPPDRPHDANALGGFRADDPDTSRKAAIFNYPRSGSQRHRALMVIVRQGAHGATASELIEATGIPHQSISTRLSELKAGGWLEPNGEERRSTLGADQEVLVATVKGRSTWETQADYDGFGP